MSFGIYLDRQVTHGPAEADRDAVRAALSRWGWAGSPGGPYQIGTEDGITVELYSRGLDGDHPFVGGSLEVRGVSTDLCRLVLDLARAGPFTVSHDGDPGAVILVTEDQRAELPDDLAAHPQLMVCPTAEALEAAIVGGFEAWLAYRDRVCGRSPGALDAEPGAAPDPAM
ncbi:MAG TPA: hypothetical protein VGE74_27630 [Gemmata sp.]